MKVKGVIEDLKIFFKLHKKRKEKEKIKQGHKNYKIYIYEVCFKKCFFFLQSNSRL